MDRFTPTNRGNSLRGTGKHLLALVFESAPRAQLCAWLRVPPEHAATKGNGDLIMMMLAAAANAFLRRHANIDRSPLVARSPGPPFAIAGGPLVAAVRGGKGAVVSALLASGSVPAGEEGNTAFLGEGGSAVLGEGGSAGIASETRSSSSSSSSGSGSGSTTTPATTTVGSSTGGSRRGNSTGSNSRGGSSSNGKSSDTSNTSSSSSTSSSNTNSSSSNNNTRNTTTSTSTSSYRSSGNNNNNSTATTTTTTTNHRRTPLHSAAVGGHLSSIRTLLLAGAKLDVTDEEGCSALHLAVFRGFDKVVEELIAAGANPDTSDSEGETPLHTACGHGSLEIVRALLRGSRRLALSARGNRGVHLEMSPLHRAALGGYCEVMRELLDHGSVSIGLLAGNARTPLHAAAMSGSSDAVHFLLSRDPSSLEAKDQEGRTALHLASGHRLGSDATLTALLTAGAKIEAKTCLGETPLLKACKALRVPAVHVLLRWGADEVAVDADGRNPTAMVLQLLQSQHPGVFRDMLKAILRALACAPADRVWRRRGWLLMVRSSSRREKIDRAGGVSCCTKIAAQECTQQCPGRMDLEKNGDNTPQKTRGGDVAMSVHPPQVSCADQDDDGTTVWCRARKTRRIVRGPERALEVERSCGMVGLGGEEGEDGRGDGELRSMVESAIGVEEDGIFRRIVAFL